MPNSFQLHRMLHRAGGCYSVWYGSKVLELKPGMTAIAVNKREDLPHAISSIMEAVKIAESPVEAFVVTALRTDDHS